MTNVPVLAAEEVVELLAVRRWVGVRIGALHGSGSWGTAFRVGRRRVLKLTRDFEEAFAWRLLAAIGRRDRGVVAAFPAVHRVAHLTGVAAYESARAEGGGWYAVLRDGLVEPLHWREREDAESYDAPVEGVAREMRWQRLLDAAVGEEDGYYVFGVGAGARAWRELGRDRPWRTFTKSISVLQARWGLVFDDLTARNLGFDRRGQIQSYDIRVFTVRPGGLAEPLWDRLPLTRELRVLS